MRHGFETIVSTALQEVEYAFDCRDDLRNETETRKLWKAWSAFLDHYTKSVSAMRRATDQGASKGWSDRLLHEQRSDPVLEYAYQARDSATHVFESLREVRPRSVSYGKVIEISGNASVTIKDNFVIDRYGRVNEVPNGSIVTKGGRFSGGTLPSNLLSHNEHYLVLREVTTRSGVYEPPFGNLPESERAIAVANYVCEWLRSKQDEIRALSKAESQDQ